MKQSKVFLSWPLAVLCILFFMGSAHAIPTVNLGMSTSEIYVGDTFEVNVVADDVEDFDPLGFLDEVLAFGFDVDYLPAEFIYNGAIVGPSFLDDSATFLDTDVAGMAFPGVSGDGILLASLSFSSLVAGDFSLGIVSDPFNPNEGLITCVYPQIDIMNSIGVEVASAAAPVPEPGTILLFGTGLAGLVGFRKKFKK